MATQTKPTDQMLKDFQHESQIVISGMLDILDQCEGRMENANRLEDYGQMVDRIMGGARTLATIVGDPHGTLMPLGDYTAILKALGYRSAQIQADSQLYSLCVAVLQDATECLKDLVEHLFDPVLKVKDAVPATLIDRVKWVSGQFSQLGKGQKQQLKAQRMNQAEIDHLLRKLGL